MENRAEKRKTRIPTNVWGLAGTSFLMDVSSEMLFNLLPLFLFNVLGVRTPIIGLIDGIAETTASLLKLVSGSVSDRLGKRKSLAVLGYGLSAVTKPLLYFATTWGWVLGIRFSDRIGKGLRTAPRDALLAGSVPSERRGLAFGLHRAADTAGAFTGLTVAGLIIWASQAGQVTLSRETFQRVVLASIIPGVLAVIVLLFAVKDVATPRAKAATGQSQVKLNRTYWAFLTVIVLFTLGNSSDAFIILRAQERGLNVLQVIGMLMTFNAVYSILSGPAGSLSDRIGRRTLVLGGWLVYGLIYLGFAQASTGGQIWGLFAIYGIYYALTEGIVRALIADVVPDEARGTAYGLYHAAIGFSALPASVIAGLLWQGAGTWTGFGPSAPFYFGAGMALLATIALFFILPPGKTNQSAG